MSALLILSFALALASGIIVGSGYPTRAAAVAFGALMFAASLMVLWAA